MFFLDVIKNKIINKLGQEKLVFSYPPDPALGDLSLVCFEVAKKLSKNPNVLATSWVNEIKNDNELNSFFAEISALGPYVNFSFKAEIMATEVIKQINQEKDKYGVNDRGGQKNIMIEYSNGNTHKEYHVGHLRNISYGDAMARLFDANGFKSIRVSYINDFGVHVAKTIWNWKNNLNYSNETEDKGFLLGKCYAEASQKLDDRPEYKLEVSKIMQEIENRKGDNFLLWKETRAWSIDYFASIYKELGIKFEKIFYESELINDGLKMVDSLLEKEILQKSDGAIIANLEEFNLGVLPVVRSDGTALYPAADLALAINKFSLYDLVESVYVVDIRQSQYFKQLFKILDLLGYKQKLTHLPYEFVILPEGMMSSRTGQVITYRELKDKIKSRLKQETRNKRSDWSDEQITKTAETLTIAVIKFEMLKVGADKIMTFNLEEALKFDGYTACYLEYSYVRLQSILRKESSTFFTGKVNFSLLIENKEKELLNKLALYPEIVILAYNKKSPSEIAKYLFELAKISNDYYHQVNILKSEKSLRKARLSLIKATSQVMQNGFKLLGLPVLEEM